jgi:hypothetical protein
MNTSGMKTIVVLLISSILFACGSSDSDKEYTILNERISEDQKQTVIDVKLSETLSKDKLKEISAMIKKDRAQIKNLSIYFYTDTFKEGKDVWATGHYSPELSLFITDETGKDKLSLQSGSPGALIIVPGKSLGKFELGMSKEEVYAMVDYTDDFKDDKWFLRTEDYENLLRFDFENNSLVLIFFTFPEFKTSDGLTVKNHTGYPDKFDIYESSESGMSDQAIINMMYVLKSGGLVFYDFDINDVEPEQRDLLWGGKIYEGDFPPGESSYGWYKQGEKNDNEEEEYGG